MFLQVNDNLVPLKRYNFNLVFALRLHKSKVKLCRVRPYETMTHGTLSGNYALFHVIGFHEDYGGRRPVCAIFEWIGTEVPKSRKFRKLKYLNANEPPQHSSTFLVGSLNENDYPNDRLTLEAKRIKPK